MIMDESSLTHMLPGPVVSPCVCAACSLKFLNVPMVTIFKNLTNVLIMWGEWSFYGQTVTSGAIWSCVVMIIGAVLAAANDITFSAKVR